MKISTAQFFSNSITQMQRQQTKVAQLQTQLGTGSQLVNPSDDALKSSTINRLNSAIERQSVFSASLDAVESRLGINAYIRLGTNPRGIKASMAAFGRASGTPTINKTANSPKDRPAMRLKLNRSRPSIKASGNAIMGMRDKSKDMIPAGRTV